MTTEINALTFDGKLQPCRARLGIIALATDLTIERELPTMLPPTVEMFTNRVLNANPLTLENLRAMHGDIARAAAGLLPGRGVQAVVYACTSGATAIGHDKIADSIRRAHPTAAITTPIAALDAACKYLEVRRLSILTPYIGELNQELAVQQTAAGREIINIDGLGFDDDTQVADILPADIVRFAKSACRPAAQALFISCTAFRVSTVIQAIENAIKIPVITSNQALAWHAAKLLNQSAPVAGFGQLLQ